MIKYSVVIVDDHTLLSQAITGMVNTFDKFKVLYTCKNGKELVDKFSESPKHIPDVVLMDINMPIMNGIETTEWITENHKNVNVMALSVEDEDTTILKMLKVGASGYLLKDTEKTVRWKDTKSESTDADKKKLGDDALWEDGMEIPDWLKSGDEIK